MNNLKLLEKPKLETQELLKSATDSLLILSDEYYSAEKYAKSMKTYHSDLAALVKRISEIKESLHKNKLLNLNHESIEELTEELTSIGAAITEITTGVAELKNMTFNLDIKNIDEIEIDQEDIAQLEAQDNKFMQAYVSYKNKLNLNTQDDVARLVGLDRRQISNLESSKHKPQFKTIKKIAEAFGADINEFI